MAVNRNGCVLYHDENRKLPIPMPDPEISGEHDKALLACLISLHVFVQLNKMVCAIRFLSALPPASFSAKLACALCAGREPHSPGVSIQRHFKKAFNSLENMSP
jgi:hypothetical protein